MEIKGRGAKEETSRSDSGLVLKVPEKKQWKIGLNDRMGQTNLESLEFQATAGRLFIL